MMKTGIYGKYHGKLYKITIDMNDNIKINTKEINNIDNTFVDIYKSGVYSKIVNRSELTDCVSISYFGIVDGEKVQVLQEKENKFQVSTSSMIVGEDLNLPRIDRETWLGWVPKEDVQLIEEKKLVNPQDL